MNARDWRGTPYYDAVCDGAAKWGGLYVDQANAVLDGLLAADLLAAGRGQQLHDFGHLEPCDYLSKACEHGLHRQCRLTCKYCQAPCQCADPDCSHDKEATNRA